MDFAGLIAAAKKEAFLARARHHATLRAMAAVGMSQAEIAKTLRVSQPAVSQRLATAKGFASLPADVALEAAVPVLKAIAAERGFSRLAVFGSLARGQAGTDSDVDLLAQPPEGATIGDLLDLKQVFEQILGRRVDLVTHGALKPGLDDDIRHQAVPL
ncbi:MAG: nucleotidyltransferase domain-containing protein [Bifidobacteriaceae bacterium]|jgi:predicted nucleotidyltransferase|nr:nucleotidyltransferase domain-containing protein [Bifidobacteriaceae bacterium]